MHNNAPKRGRFAVVTAVTALVATLLLLQRTPDSDDVHIQGLWIGTELWYDGEHFVADPLMMGRLNAYWRFSADTIENGMIVEGECDRADGLPDGYRLDASRIPKHLDWDEKGEEMLATYSLRGDTLVVCHSLEPSGNRRPQAVPARGRKGDGLAIMVFMRSDVQYKDMNPEQWKAVHSRPLFKSDSPMGDQPQGPLSGTP